MFQIHIEHTYLRLQLLLGALRNDPHAPASLGGLVDPLVHSQSVEAIPSLTAGLDL